MKLTTQPYKGMKDFMGQEYQELKYIFDVWRSTCEKFGYKEYITPLLEPADLYRAKSGEVKEELFVLRDRANRELALRPEMTPSITRVVAGIYPSAQKPIRLFSIAPFYRNEAPQKGRSREFWQLNADIFGDNSINSDVEILSLAIEIMKAFNAPKDSFKLYFNSRILINDFFEKVLKLDQNVNKSEISRVLDKAEKLTEEDFSNYASEKGLTQQQIRACKVFLSSQDIENDLPELKNSEGVAFVRNIQRSLQDLGNDGYVEFRPSIIRGFDYYDGLIFEIFDMNKNNNRSLFGGGRYNGLADIFGSGNFPACGFAPGNVTTWEFLKNWSLLPKFEDETYYLPLLPNVDFSSILRIANKIRTKGIKIEMGLSEESLSNGIRTANKKSCEKIIILGENELKDKKVTIKDLKTGTQKTETFESFLSTLS